MELSQVPSAFDPYDLWMTPVGVVAKRSFYQGGFKGKCLAISIALADWLAPRLSRRVFRCKPHSFPITTAQWILSQDHIDDPASALDALLLCASSESEKFGQSWGLGFDWMSKNGLYNADIPFITHTPYAMEALLHLARYPAISESALGAFQQSWQFMNSLKEMHSDQECLALSYAPLDEPRIVVNANAYACLAYSLFFQQGLHVEQSKSRAIRVARWLLQQQNSDGSWHYYADKLPGNFIDGFHTCFVLKNLIKAGRNIPEIQKMCAEAIDQGVLFIERHFLDPDTGLIRRFTERDIKDPFVWDLYDQAEYLGLLLYLDRQEQAVQFRDHVQKIFKRGGHWYCRKDILGRLWGRDFYRWGIMPFLKNNAELERRLLIDS